jgi:hypothetical protein
MSFTECASGTCVFQKKNQKPMIKIDKWIWKKKIWDPKNQHNLKSDSNRLITSQFSLLNFPQKIICLDQTNKVN